MGFFRNGLAGLLAVGMLAGSGCLHYQCPKNPRPAKPISEFFQREFVAEKRPDKFDYLEKRVIREENGYTVKDIELKYKDLFGEHAISARYYDFKEKKGEKSPVIIVSPIMGGEGYSLENIPASNFAKNGYSVVLIKRPKLTKEINGFGDIDRLLKARIINTMRVIDWLETKQDIDAKRIGAFGISLGGIGNIGSVFDDRVKLVVSALSGGDLSHILAYTDMKGIGDKRVELLNRGNLTLEQGIEVLREDIKYEPLVMAEFADPKRFFLILAAADKTVPFVDGKKLRAALGNPETIIVPTGHYTSVFLLPYLDRKARMFFDKELKK